MNSRPSYSGNAIRPLLKRAGLDEKEVEVYLALLSIKAGRVSLIARAAKQSRSHTYLVLQSLEEKGLVSHVEQGKVLQFIAEPPHRLVDYAKNREQEWKETQSLLEGALPLLKTLTPNFVGTPRVTVLHGIDGMKQVYRDILQNEFCGLFNAERAEQVFGGNIVHMLLGKEAQLHARDLLVDNGGAKKWLNEVIQNEHYEVRLLPKETQFGTDTVIFGDSVALFAYDSENTIILIENKNIHDTFQTFFEALWSQSEKTA